MVQLYCVIMRKSYLLCSVKLKTDYDTVCIISIWYLCFLGLRGAQLIYRAVFAINDTYAMIHSLWLIMALSLNMFQIKGVPPFPSYMIHYYLRKLFESKIEIWPIFGLLPPKYKIKWVLMSTYIGSVII